MSRLIDPKEMSFNVLICDGLFEGSAPQKGLPMGTNRNVENLVSVFDLNVSKTLEMPKGATARVLFVYDKKTNTKKFVIVKTDMPRTHISGIISWLENNIDVDHLAFGLKSNRMAVSWSQGALRLQPG